jgi:hypothetical protein
MRFGLDVDGANDVHVPNRYPMNAESCKLLTVCNGDGPGSRVHEAEVAR